MKKKKLFLLRGLTREQRHWGNFPDRIMESIPNLEVHCLEIPGSGIYHKFPSPMSIKDFVNSIRNDYLKLKGEDNILLAVSLGGMIATEWANMYPQDFSKLILINTSFGNFSPFYRRLYLKNLPKLIAISKEKDFYKKEHMILELVSNNKEKYKENANNWAIIQKTAPISRKNSFKQIFAAMKYKAPLRPPKENILLLGSSKDRLVSSKCTMDISKKWNIPVIYHPSAGHEMALDAPEFIIDNIKLYI